MNEPTRNDEAGALNATDVDVRAAEWLQRRNFWKWTDQDQVALDAWLAELPAHQLAYWRLDAAWDRTERLVVLRSAMQAQPENVRRMNMWPLFAGLAASAAIAVLIGAGAYYFNSPRSEQVFATAVGGREIVTLADGSQIELNTNTVLRAHAQDGVRTVSLEKGEAYFQIKHDPAHPFVVTADNGRVLDLGTKFLVRKDAESLEVTLMEGRVRFQPSVTQEGQSRSAVLKPGDVVLATPASMSVTRKPVDELARELSWRQGMLVFRHSTIAAAAAEFNRYNSEKLIVADTGTGALTFSSAFPINGIEAFVRLAQKSLGLHVQRQGEAIVISR